MCQSNLNGIKCHRCGTYVEREANKMPEDEKISSEAKNTFTKKVKSFVSSASEHVGSGFKNVSDQTKKQRLAVCKKCNSYNKQNNSCNDCGCFLSLKTSWASESCPQGKWAREIHSNKSKTCGGCDKKKT